MSNSRIFDSENLPHFSFRGSKSQPSAASEEPAGLFHWKGGGASKTNNTSGSAATKNDKTSSLSSFWLFRSSQSEDAQNSQSESFDSKKPPLFPLTETSESPRRGTKRRRRDPIQSTPDSGPGPLSLFRSTGRRVFSVFGGGASQRPARPPLPPFNPTVHFPAFTRYTDLACSANGGHVIFATDELMGSAKNLIAADTASADTPSLWGTRRRRRPGHDWCLIRLAAPAKIYGLSIETTGCEGAVPPSVSVEAASLTRSEAKEIEASIEESASEESVRMMEERLRTHSVQDETHWTDLLPMTKLTCGAPGGGCNNFFEICGGGRECTHIRLNLFPDGCLARLRVYGEGEVELQKRIWGEDMIELSSAANGAVVIATSNEGLGRAKALLLPSRTTERGWITDRSGIRAPIICEGPDGLVSNLRGHDWVVVGLGHRGYLERVEVDTCGMKGETPDMILFESVDQPDLLRKNLEEQKAQLGVGQQPGWSALMAKRRIEEEKIHVYRRMEEGRLAASEECFDAPLPATHIRISIFPDGGISRIRLWGRVL